MEVTAADTRCSTAACGPTAHYAEAFGKRAKQTEMIPTVTQTLIYGLLGGYATVQGAHIRACMVGVLVRRGIPCYTVMYCM